MSNDIVLAHTRVGIRVYRYGSSGSYREIINFFLGVNWKGNNVEEEQFSEEKEATRIQSPK